MFLGQNLLAAIKAKGMNQKTFAAKMGVSGGAVSLWINGHREPELADIEKMSALLGVSLTSLVGPQPDSRPAPAPADTPSPTDQETILYCP